MRTPRRTSAVSSSLTAPPSLNITGVVRDLLQQPIRDAYVRGRCVMHITAALCPGAVVQRRPVPDAVERVGDENSAERNRFLRWPRLDVRRQKPRWALVRRLQLGRGGALAGGVSSRRTPHADLVSRDQGKGDSSVPELATDGYGRTRWHVRLLRAICGAATVRVSAHMCDSAGRLHVERPSTDVYAIVARVDSGWR
mgnify:CR=1 FL=1